VAKHEKEGQMKFGATSCRIWDELLKSRSVQRKPNVWRSYLCYVKIESTTCFTFLFLFSI